MGAGGVEGRPVQGALAGFCTVGGEEVEAGRGWKRLAVRLTEVMVIFIRSS